MSHVESGGLARLFCCSVQENLKMKEAVGQNGWQPRQEVSRVRDGAEAVGGMSTSENRCKSFMNLLMTEYERR